jgi:hypothetical protein
VPPVAPSCNSPKPPVGACTLAAKCEVDAEVLGAVRRAARFTNHQARHRPEMRGPRLLLPATRAPEQQPGQQSPLGDDAGAMWRHQWWDRDSRDHRVRNPPYVGPRLSDGCTCLCGLWHGANRAALLLVDRSTTVRRRLPACPVVAEAVAAFAAAKAMAGRMGVCVRGQGLGGVDAYRSGCEVAARRDACFPSERRDECAWRLVAHLARDRADRTTRRE